MVTKKKGVKKTSKKISKKSVKSKDVKKFSFRELYKDSFSFIKESKRHIYYGIYLVLFFAILGFVVPIPEEYANRLLAYFEALIEQTKDFGAWEMTAFLFQNNVWASFISYISGFFFGVFPAFNAMSNGFVLGFAAKISVAENGWFSLWRLLPHGIFELPALFISIGMGIKFGSVVIFGRSWKKMNDFFRRSFRTFVLIVVPLLVVAAVIEGLLIVFG